MNPEKQTEISNKIHELLHAEKHLTYYDALGILEVVKAYYVTGICKMQGPSKVTVHKVNL